MTTDNKDTELAAAINFEDLSLGLRIPPLERTPTKTQLVMYAGAEDDYTPIHFDHHFAVAAGHPGVINHGWLTFAILLQTVTTCFPPQLAKVVSTKARYLQPTYPDQVLICTAVVRDISDSGGQRLATFDMEATDQAGISVARGEVVLDFF